MNPSRTCRTAALIVAAAGLALAQEGADSPGGERFAVHALRGARVVTRPGHVLEDATVVIRDGVVEAVGAIPVPPDARVWDMRGLTIYPGLIEPYLQLEGGAAKGDDGDGPRPKPPAPQGARHPNPQVRAERRQAAELDLGADTLKGLRKAGFTAALVAPGHGVVRGTSALVTLGEAPARERVLAADAAQHLAFEAPGWRTQQYPHSLMGAMALTRQTLLDAQHQAAAWTAYQANPLQPRPAADLALRALAPTLSGELPLCFEAQDTQMVLRGMALLDEFGIRPWVVTGGHDTHRWLEALSDLDATQPGAWLVVSLNFPPIPTWDDPDEAVAIETETLRSWYLAPEEPARLEQAGIRFAFTSHGLESRADFRARVREAIGRGLSPDVALAALTTAPAALLHAPQLGVIAPGAVANLTITDGELFAEHSRVVAVWVDGLAYPADVAPPMPKDVAGTWALETDALGELEAKLSILGAEPFTLDDAELWRDRLTLTIPAASLGSGANLELEARVEGRLLRGSWQMGDVEGTLTGRLQPKAKGEGEDEDGDGEDEGGEDEGGEAEDGEDEGGEAEGGAEDRDAVEPPLDPSLVVLASPSWPPQPEPAPAAVLVKDATLWTLGPAGIVRGDMLVRDGKIVAVGEVAVPPGLDPLVIEAGGRPVTPGLVDCHSHSFIQGGVNEGTHNCTAEVRIADVVDAETVRIYQQLAGGLTTANLLHGSANAIGGQNAVVKLRWGAPASALRFAGATPGIKFALGENPKRSNWGENRSPRYPTSRSGVAESIRARFLAARDYTREWDAWRRLQPAPDEPDDSELQEPTPIPLRRVPPRRDLQLEALAEILRGERLVHCHSYRQDEILALIRIAEEFGFTVGTFQHVLEGYKVADEIAAHGAGASTFSDWWAYKVEVYDAIAYNGALMTRRGVLVSFNSDSSEMARRLNQEAAKAVRYGGLEPEAALALVSRNAAKQLRIDDRVGSLEPGKDADFALWSADPLSMQAVCQQTWVDGRRYFDRARDAEAYARYAEERRVLLAAARAARSQPGARTGDGYSPTFGRRALHQAYACCDHDEGN